LKPISFNHYFSFASWHIYTLLLFTQHHPHHPRRGPYPPIPPTRFVFRYWFYSITSFVLFLSLVFFLYCRISSFFSLTWTLILLFIPWNYPSLSDYVSFFSFLSVCLVYEIIESHFFSLLCLLFLCTNTPQFLILRVLLPGSSISPISVYSLTDKEGRRK
jgi:hypothetical protein